MMRISALNDSKDGDDLQEDENVQVSKEAQVLVKFFEFS